MAKIKLEKKEVSSSKNKPKKSKVRKTTKTIANKNKKTVKTKTAKKKVVRAKKIRSQDSPKDSYFAKWIAPEHVKTEQDMFIYYGSVILSFFAIIYFIYQGSFIVVATFFILLVVIILHIYQNPRDIECKIDLDGISFDDSFFEYKNIDSFEIEEGEYLNILRFKLKNSILPFKEIQIIDQNPIYLRMVLKNFLIEKKQEASLISFSKKSKFDEYFTQEDFEEYLDEKEKIEKLNKS